MSDIHGCYDDMIKMLEQITFTDEDTLILAGDYIDRGSQSFEMLKWIESNPKNVIFLRGNHDEEFAYSIDLMYGFLSQNECSESSLDDTKLIYELLRQLSLKQGNGVIFFDHYGTIRELIEIEGVTLEEELPYNDGNVYKSYDEEMDCTFYDIDCGCASRNRRSNAKLACLRLDDEKIFYV